MALKTTSIDTYNYLLSLIDWSNLFPLFFMIVNTHQVIIIIFLYLFSVLMFSPLVVCSICALCYVEDTWTAEWNTAAASLVIDYALNELVRCMAGPLPPKRWLRSLKPLTSDSFTYMKRNLFFYHILSWRRFWKLLNPLKMPQLAEHSCTKYVLAPSFISIHQYGITY